MISGCRTSNLLTASRLSIDPATGSNQSIRPVQQHRRWHLRSLLQQLAYPTSNGVNDISSARRSYFGAPCAAIAFATVLPAMPSLLAIAAFGTPQRSIS